jgi:hypothetical protein
MHGNCVMPHRFVELLRGTMNDLVPSNEVFRQVAAKLTSDRKRSSEQVTEAS